MHTERTYITLKGTLKPCYQYNILLEHDTNWFILRLRSTVIKLYLVLKKIYNVIEYKNPLHAFI